MLRYGLMVLGVFTFTNFRIIEKLMSRAREVHITFTLELKVKTVIKIYLNLLKYIFKNKRNSREIKY